MDIKRMDIAKFLGIGSPYMSDILNGHKTISRKMAEDLSLLIPWTDFKFWREPGAHKKIEPQYETLCLMKKKDAA